MTTSSLSFASSFAGYLPFTRAGAAKSFDIGPVTRAAVAAVAIGFTAATLIALTRGFLGFAPDHPNIRELAIMIHVSTVLPAVPLGGYLLLAPKGGARHKRLGKLWLLLMVVTALSAIFIKTSGSFSPIHIFVPLTLWSSYKVIATARRGDMVGHEKEIVGLYLGALMIPGIVAFALPGRLMNTWLLG